MRMAILRSLTISLCCAFVDCVQDSRGSLFRLENSRASFDAQGRIRISARESAGEKEASVGQSNSGSHFWPFSVVAGALSKSLGIGSDVVGEEARSGTSMELKLAELEKETQREDPKQSISCRDYAIPKGAPAQDIHMVLTNGYSMEEKSGDLKISSLPWMYQCSIESALASKAKVTLWYRGYNRVVDDVTGSRLQVKRHVFDPNTETGRWWAQHSTNGTLQCPHSHVTQSDFVRLDVMHRFGGVYIDLDMVLLSHAILHVQDGVAAQQYTGAHTLTNSFSKLRKGHPFAECWLATWRRHWKAYVMDSEECQEIGYRDCSKRPDWGFMGPAVLTDAYLSCPDNVAIYPPAAFGHDTPCSDMFFNSSRSSGIMQLTTLCSGNETNLQKYIPNKEPMFVGRFAHHACNSGTTILNQMVAKGDKPDPSSFMAKAMTQQCPKTLARMT